MKPDPIYSQAWFKSEYKSAQPQDFAVVTAYNPQGRIIDDQRNSQLDSELARSLRIAGIPFWRVVGGDAKFVHAEAGYGFGSSLEFAIDLGRKFDQEAIFWIEGDALFLVDCADGGKFALGSWAARQKSTLANTLRMDNQPDHVAVTPAQYD